MPDGSAGSGEGVTGAQHFMWWYDEYLCIESQFDAQFMEAENWTEETKVLFAERALQCAENTKKRATWAAALLANRDKSDRQQREDEQREGGEEPRDGERTPGGQWDTSATAGNGAGTAVYVGRGP